MKNKNRKKCSCFWISRKRRVQNINKSSKKGVVPVVHHVSMTCFGSLTTNAENLFSSYLTSVKQIMEPAWNWSKNNIREIWIILKTKIHTRHAPRSQHSRALFFPSWQFIIRFSAFCWHWNGMNKRHWLKSEFIFHWIALALSLARSQFHLSFRLCAESLFRAPYCKSNCN